MTVIAVVIGYEVFTPTYTCTTAIESNLYTHWIECHESEVISIRHRVMSFERDYNQFLYMNKENENMNGIVMFKEVLDGIDEIDGVVCVGCVGHAEADGWEVDDVMMASDDVRLTLRGRCMVCNEGVEGGGVECKVLDGSGTVNWRDTA